MAAAAFHALGSLVVSDTTLFQLSGTSPRDAGKNKLVVAPPTYGAPPTAIRLRYGNRYEFRCRFADLTGGGPGIDDKPINPAQHPKSLTRFRRHMQPKAVRLATNSPRPGLGQRTPAVATVTTIDVWRPLIGYPEMVFAGIDAPAVVAQVIANAAAARAAGDAVGVNDPDVTHLRVTVEVRAPAHDTGPATLREGEFRKLYSTEIAFPPFDPDAVLVPGAALTLTLDYVDVADVAMLVPPAAGAANLPVPRARDVRLRLAPHCADKNDYFGEAWVQTGPAVEVATRQRRRTKPACSQTKRPNAT